MTGEVECLRYGGMKTFALLLAGFIAAHAADVEVGKTVYRDATVKLVSPTKALIIYMVHSGLRLQRTESVTVEAWQLTPKQLVRSGFDPSLVEAERTRRERESHPVEAKPLPTPDPFKITAEQWAKIL